MTGTNAGTKCVSCAASTGGNYNVVVGSGVSAGTAYTVVA
jgi:hypothetical protein